jgi:hypothetical protein
MIGLTAAARRLVAATSPVLCIDTCSLLDLIRDPTRSKFERRHADAALHLVARAETRPATLMIVLTEQVINELDTNLDNVTADGKSAIERINLSLELFKAYGLLSSLPSPAVDPAAFVDAAKSIIQRFRRVAIITKGSAASQRRAWGRVSGPRAPARKGKESSKDCVIIENYLQLILEARAQGLTEKALLLTSNTADYADAPSHRLHRDLEPDFDSAGLEFASDFVRARYSI